jgi:hypothetical protein
VKSRLRINVTHYLQKVLPDSEPLLTSGIVALEKSTGHSGVDTRLIADILKNAHGVMRSLGLDTADTTGRELYQALISAIKTDSIEELLQSCDYTLYVIDKDVISFNLIDIIENYHHALDYERRSVNHGQRSLRGEIVDRYLRHTRTNEATTLEIASTIGLLPGEDL